MSGVSELVTRLDVYALFVGEHNVKVSVRIRKCN